ncbi:acetyltransferase [Mycobacterium sp. GA-1841]|uniref:acyltransferase family protein n=1 Tax=Mycobacterium sp. GA-1841 TaxID=1834154 RepID=UPI00096D8677|nr:acyltransferase family protein [Mycobacterium sp. GA-1841]OMC40294.1 acetyltransferase [Mycobacterium sp. GA-1841]
MQAIVDDPVLVPAAPRQARDGLIGLSGVAIVMVVVGHFWFGQASAGLDVLLMLTGFLLGRRVLRDIDTAGPRAMAGEFAWLARWLVPPMVLVLAVSAVLTGLVQPQTRWEAFAEQTLAGLGFYQNWQLLQSAEDYVQAGAAVTPLHHLWAVSVLAQFAVAFLVLAAALAVMTKGRGRSMRRRLLVAVCGGAMVASAYYAVVTHSDNPMLAYYSTAARTWEPLAGVLAAAFVTRPGRTTGSPAWPRAGEFLRSAPLVALGAVAYPLFLWHWPLLIFWLATVNRDAVGVADGSAVAVVAALMAWLTARFTQSPWRAQRRWRSHAAALTGAVVVLVAVTLVATSLMWQGHVAAARASGAELGMLPVRDYPGARALIENRRVAKLPMRPSALEAADDIPPSSEDHCVTGFTGDEVITCTYGDPKGDRTIALAGGSHSEHWLTALHQIGRRHGVKVTTYLKLGCPLTTKPVPIIAGSFQPYPSCRTWSDRALAQIIADRPDYVFFTATRPILNGPGDYVPDYYLGIWDELAANAIPMLGMRDTPWMVRDGWFFSPVDCLSDGGDAEGCGLPRDEALAQRNPTLDYLARYPSMKVLDLSDAVCRSSVCRAVEGNVLIYHDAHHLSGAYVRTLTDELARQMSEALGWW